MTAWAEAFSRSGVETLMDGLDRALAFAALHLERRLATPVDEGVHVLQAEFHGERQILHARLELGGSDAIDERVELVAVVAIRLVEAYPPLDRLGAALGGQARLQPLAE